MLKIGITGNIGSGKTTVSKIFAQLGIPVYDADTRAKQVMIENVAVKKSIVDLFGEHAYDHQGNLNRAHIAAQAFTNQQLLTQLNAIVHPSVFADFDQWCAQQPTAIPYILKEAALLFESGSYKKLDAVIVVTTTPELQLKRAMARDGASEQEIKARMAKQWDQATKVQMAQYTITNDETQLVLPQVLTIHHTLTTKTG
ncbi:MAG: dephospho-CoA kinase [Bacteroidia bacterium]|jgi:dephospho-CoA kinase|nr:dephospho-CoA kinase [Bacteroidia bacterium]